ncbi:putative bifunctional diguanylate cyclase/phosphodiesterase [Yinghuangia seranimata]|uniref:putative bifunctional diguanylate cyclase/phosphodiesterase n=1 Tax=Yinghuangia seranimata TaxID=408067 RepID=UPI00248AA34A|nr:bifunctional diguanylate cyclase/phosphodiesterase [Yinghuangia seranimata]MDI2129361.1 bifunctional diguanylate cyclase/phosphodiesterase [Yinghuangia seranimata]
MRRIGRTDLSRVARPGHFVANAVAVGGIGNLVLVAAVAHLALSGRDPVPLRDPGVWIMLALVVLDGVHTGLTRRGLYVPGAMPSVAVTYGLLLVHGWVLAALWQTIPVALAGLIRRDSLWRIAYTVGHYVLAFVAADLVLHLCRIRPEGGTPRHLAAIELPVVLAAGCCLVMVSQGIGWLLRASWRGMRARTLAREEMRSRCIAHGALIGIAPLIAIVEYTSPWVLPLFAIPLYSLYQSTRVSFDREQEVRHDALTGLPNRRLLLERGDSALRESGGRGKVALFLLDLHRFHEVNDTLGHLAGDRLLQQVGRRLLSVVGSGDTVARLGGDEFAVLVPDLYPADSDAGPLTANRVAMSLARQVVEVLGEPFELDDLSLDIEVSVGVAVFPDHATGMQGLLQYADVAMYLAKRMRSGVELYDPARDVNTREKLLLLGDLRRALDVHQVELHYQPKVSFTTGRVDGCEALVRWCHPDRGYISPEEFVHLAEETGLMPRLTRYVVDEALSQVARWHKEGIDVPVAVNVSARDIHAPAFADTVAAGLLRYGVPPGALHLEITERVLLEEPQRAADSLDALRKLGVRLSLDDFGTGYSSFVHLRHIPVSEIKIDRSFVARLTSDEEDAAIVRSTVDLAHSLGLRVVAEGVEDEPTWDRLRDLGCDSAQGWLIARALPRDEATAWLVRHGVGARMAPQRRAPEQPRQGQVTDLARPPHHPTRVTG